jgi:hypothetical protein
MPRASRLLLGRDANQGALRPVLRMAVWPNTGSAKIFAASGFRGDKCHFSCGCDMDTVPARRSPDVRQRREEDSRERIGVLARDSNNVGLPIVRVAQLPFGCNEGRETQSHGFCGRVPLPPYVCRDRDRDGDASPRSHEGCRSRRIHSCFHVAFYRWHASGRFRGMFGAPAGCRQRVIELSHGYPRGPSMETGG